MQVTLLQAHFVEPRSGWPKPIQIPRPGDKQLVGPNGKPIASGEQEPRVRSMEKNAASALFGDQIVFTPPDEGERRRPKMRDPEAPSGPVRSDGTPLTEMLALPEGGG